MMGEPPLNANCPLLGKCPNHTRMEAKFLKHGDWIGCAGCCRWCKERKNCEIACAEVLQLSFEDVAKEEL